MSYKNAKKDRIIGISAISVVALIIVAVIVLSTLLNDNGFITADGNLSENYKKSLKTEKITDNFAEVYDSLTLRLAKTMVSDDKNVSFSVADTLKSVAFLGALSDTDTRVETEKFLNLDTDRFAKSINTLQKRTAYSEKDGVGLRSGNLLYINNKRLINVKKRFLKENGKIYGLDILRDNFSDKSFSLTKSKQIVSYTDGAVSLPEEFDANSVMSLISTGSYCGGFSKNTDTALKKGSFTGRGMFYDCEYFKTIGEKFAESDTYYAVAKEIDDNCTFVAITAKQKEGLYTSFSDILSGITETNGSLRGFVNNMKEQSVALSVPQCVTSVNAPYYTNLRDTLINFGVENVFQSSADMSRFAEESNVAPNLDNFYIAGDINIKPSTENDGKFSEESYNECKISYELNQAFIYFICDTESMLPIYFGEVAEIV